MKTTAAVVHEKGGAWRFEDVELEAPRADEVRVRIVGTGMCQTDLHVRAQYMPTPLPLVLGHEGAGVVEAVGDAVTKVAPGDHVVLTFPSCGRCRYCLSGRPAYCVSGLQACFACSRLDGSGTLHGHDHAVHGAFFQQSSFATYALATERNVVKVRKDAPLELLGPLGCGIQTGAGAVLNVLQPEAGSAVVVFGTGAVGISAIMAAKLVGCTTIVAVDINDDRLALARELGATHTVNSRTEDAPAAIQALAPGGVDYALDTTARPEILRRAVEALKPGGVCGHIGGAPFGTEVAIDMNVLLAGRTVRGILQGDSVPDLFIPRLIDLHLAGLFPFDRLVRFYDFADIDQAAQDAASGATIKPILRIGAL